MGVPILNVLGIAVGVLFGVIGVLVTLYAAEMLARPLRRFVRAMFPWLSTPSVPEYSTKADLSRAGYRERAIAYLTKNPGSVSQLGVHESAEPLKSAWDKPGLWIDCICAVLSHAGRTILLLPSPSSWPQTEGVGRTAIITRLLGMHLPYTELLGLKPSDVTDSSKFTLLVEHPGPWCLVASDMAYLTVTDGRLKVAPVRGELTSFLWDVARHLCRSTVLDYKTGAHRRPPMRSLLVDVFNSLLAPRLPEVYSGFEEPRDVQEIIFVRRASAPQDRTADLKTMTASEGLHALEGSLALASDMHGSEFWDRPWKLVRRVVRAMLDPLHPADLPRMRELVLESVDGSIPGYVYDDAVSVIQRRVQDVNDRCLEATALLGIAAYNRELLKALPTISNLRMLVLSGEKVFRDAMFWRRLSSGGREVRVEVLMLDPDCDAAVDVERTAYGDRREGFLRDEIRSNLRSLNRMDASLRDMGMRVSIDCRLYRARPQLRMTILDDAQVFVAPYLLHSRTGQDTAFLSLHSTGPSRLVEALVGEFKRAKDLATPLKESR